MAQVRLGTTTSAALAQLIDRRIRPELRVVRMRLSLDDVQPEQLVPLEKAKEYLRLREESWRLRAAATRCTWHETTILLLRPHTRRGTIAMAFQ